MVTSMDETQELKNTQRKKLINSFLSTFKRRVTANPPGVCCISTHIAYLRTARSQTCGKCVPCAKGLEQLENMLQQIHDGTADMDLYVDMLWLAQTIKDTADCAIGYEAAYMVLANIKNFKDEYLYHINHHKCQSNVSVKVPCMYNCPANVNIPGYIALIKDERYADAINLIREDNPFPTSCAFVCERPCEMQCRRSLIDAEINIRGLKKFAVDQIHADQIPVPPRNVDTGKRIAVVGGGPSGLTCAYFLARMGHSVVVFEAKEKLGGMLRYGIPGYRLPKDRLDEDINGILAVGGIEVRLNARIGRDITTDQLEKEFDAVYISIGAQKGRVIPIKNYDNPNVASAVEMLDQIGHGNLPDFTGKNVVVIGGGNVAMDCARSAVRCGAASVTLAVREPQVDMTALPSEIQGAIEEGVELMTMFAPSEIRIDENGNVVGLITKPQITSYYDANTGIPMVRDADKETCEIPCDVIFMAIGQAIESESFTSYEKSPRGTFITDATTALKDHPGIFAGGDCVSGPATAIMAIGAGKIAAINIDSYLGYHHHYHVDIKIPNSQGNMRHHMGRVNLTEKSARERKKSFCPVENNMSREEAMQECNKCLRCDIFGSGTMKGGLL
jgi:NADPH-dependent glutamate synthase beta subunit-like oxidoreductase